MDPVAISALAQEVMQRELARDPEQFKVDVPAQPKPEKTISPQHLATIGGLADAASTYAFMKRGTARESNPIARAMGGNSPERTALAAIVGLLATKAATGFIGKKFPKVADALAANLGAQQLSLATHNTANTFGLNETKKRQGSFGAYGDTMIRAGIENNTKSKVR